MFRVLSFGPGVTPRNHRTDTIDYASVISGELEHPEQFRGLDVPLPEVIARTGNAARFDGPENG